MFWQDNQNTAVDDLDVVDITFRTNAKQLPVDHAYCLSSAILKILPWIKNEAQAGIHLIYGAGSGNGWERPEGKDGLIYLSRRTRFGIRIPKSRLNEVKDKLTGLTLEVADNKLKLQDPHVRELVKHSAVYSRNVVTDADISEEDFLQYAMKQLKTMGIISKKMLSGKTNILKHPDKNLQTKSLLLVELDIRDSLKLQANGLGDYKHMGCGIFLPHKTIEHQATE